MNENSRLDPIPEDFETIDAAADFWDNHSLSDYWDLTEEVTFDVDLQRAVILVPLERELARRLARFAHQQGLSSETLVNLWVSQRLQNAA